ncbi:HIT domain-containing protein [Streptomyces sp. NBC_01498]|uniref:HIT family protein n=1 Tax=Streptomyces sp. NBC_01498 TaxID=2975870 RepID=UPI002E7BF6D9|nr:HIT domain-containing protein [Streptomyces sp. NBC_01498]WTL24039.1 HIT domain-containing protein [Streptomyces sp. NBC_01498]
MSTTPESTVTDLPGCLFCPGSQGSTVIASAETAYVRLDNFPSSPGHMEVVPRRHVESFYDLSSVEVRDIYALACDAGAHVPDADGWTVGVNEGRAAGRTVDHVHVHLIPRRLGDVPDPTGGVRWVLPGTAALPTARVRPESCGGQQPHSRHRFMRGLVVSDCPGCAPARPVPDAEAATTADRGTALWAAAGAVALDRDASAGVPAAYREGMTRAVVLLGRLAEEAAAGSGGQAEDGAPEAQQVLLAQLADEWERHARRLRAWADEYHPRLSAADLMRGRAVVLCQAAHDLRHVTETGVLPAWVAQEQADEDGAQS